MARVLLPLVTPDEIRECLSLGPWSFLAAPARVTQNPNWPRGGRGPGEVMSLLNAWVSPKRALVAVDTDGLLVGSGEHFSFSKLIPLAHARTVIAARGDAAFLHCLFTYYFTTNRAEVSRDYDAMAAHALHAIAVAQGHWKMNSAANTPYQFVMVGWSPAKGRMVGLRFKGETDDVGTDQEDLEQLIAPEVDGCQGIQPTNDTNMIRLAGPQSRWLREQGAAGGGELIIAELSKSAIDIRIRPIR
jgi:hypothetical protein